jgi:hypothetical protein
MPAAATAVPARRVLLEAAAVAAVAALVPLLLLILFALAPPAPAPLWLR